MTDDEARNLFSAARDGELDAATKRAFEQRLADRPALRQEFEHFARALDEARGALEQGTRRAPNLLQGVQTKLRVRSRGRFYSDRFAQQQGPGRFALVTACLVIALALLAGWLLWYHTPALAPQPEHGDSGPSRTGLPRG